MDDTPDAAPVGPDPPIGGSRAPFLVFLLTEAILAILAVATPYPASGALWIAMVGLGGAALSLRIIQVRPARPTGWWLIAASLSVLVAAQITVAVTRGRYEGSTISVLPLGLAAVSYGLLSAGFAVLGRRRNRLAGALDTLDAVMVGAGALLLGWIFVTDPSQPDQAGISVAAALLLFGSGLVLITAMKLILSAGVRNTSIVLLGLAAGALLAATVEMFIPAVHAATVVGSRVSKLLWTAQGTLIGAAAMHPSFAQVTRAITTSGTESSPRRVLLFVAIAVVVPLSLALDLLDRPTSFDRTLVGVAVPTAAAATVLLTLVSRLTVTARVSERRAEVLRSRTAELAEAMDRQATLQRQLSYRATHDPLTGLSNRLVVVEELERARDTERDARIRALLLLDLDGFKDINDTYGHPTGDDLLTQVGRRLSAAVPGSATVARLGGDEFALVVGFDVAADATARAEDILTVLQRPFRVGDHELYVSASIGLLLTDPADGAITASEALRDADLALYAAKQAGKNRLVTFRPELRAARLDRSRIGAGLRHALSHDELRLHYQTVVHLGTRDVVAVEALARWRPANGESVPPDEFIPIAEATGTINAFGAWALRRACLDARRWYETHGVAVAVNVSGRQLDAPGFVDMVTGVLTEVGLPGSGLVLELTESSLLGNTPDRSDFAALRRLRARGVRVAIDDFGTGYSSLAYLAQLPADIVKLDKSFIQRPAGRTADEPNWALAGAIVEAIASVGLTVIAEGVETESQARSLRRIGCPMAQGFLFSRPVPAAGIDRLLAGSGPA